MDVDPLRPKTVPLSAETILWFEFLLDPKLLEVHLSKPHPEPTPIEMISQFLSVNMDPGEPPVVAVSPDVDPVPAVKPNGGGLKFGRKQLALKILALKVASFLKWNLDTFDTNLTLPIQIQLFHDLCTITAGRLITLPLSSIECPISADGSEDALSFALTLYHRWVLRAQVYKDQGIKSFRPNFVHVIGATEPPNNSRYDAFVAALEPFTQVSIDYLSQLCDRFQGANTQFKILTLDSFPALDAAIDTIKQNFAKMMPISLVELKAQINYDLCVYYLFAKSYTMAVYRIKACKKYFSQLLDEYRAATGTDTDTETFVYCNVTKEQLHGCLLACGLQEEAKGLFQKMNVAMNDNVQLIPDILKQDIIAQEIPLVHRQNLELDIEAVSPLPAQILADWSLATKFDTNFTLKITILNTVRNVLEHEMALPIHNYLQKIDQYPEGIATLIDVIQSLKSQCDETALAKLRSFMIDLMLRGDTFHKFRTAIEKLALFDELELREIEGHVNEQETVLPAVAMHMDWISCDTKNLIIEHGRLERQLIVCDSATVVRQLLVKLASTNPSKPLWTINPSWSVPIPLKSVLMSLPPGFLQDFAYVLLGKAKEMCSKQSYTQSIALLNVLKAEVLQQQQQQQQVNIAIIANILKLGKLVNWEILLVQILQSLEEWPPKIEDYQMLSTKCKQCVSALQNGDNIIPRIEILEYCTAMLLNLDEWASVVISEKRFASLELSSALAVTILDMEKIKGTKKVYREVWDLVLPMFVATSTGKRGNISRESPSLVSTNLIPFLRKIRNPMVISILASLLSRIHNILKDEPNLEVMSDYFFLWPSNISNTNGYNIKLVSETLNIFLTHALKYHPNNIAWIKLRGDLEYVNGNNEAALKCYVSALMTGTDYCSIHLQRPLLDDYLIRRMIKACTNLGCHMQAAVLCQFLEEIDYSLAFKCIPEKTVNITDSLDAYYHCIWDPSLLEYIVNLHTKKGENRKKLQSMAYLGQLELNANNNEEIKREAASIRKTNFLRALAKQYLL